MIVTIKDRTSNSVIARAEEAYFSVSLLGHRYNLKNIEIVRTDGEVPPPTFTQPTAVIKHRPWWKRLGS